MGIGEDIKQSKFKSEFNKATINVIYTNSWINQQFVEMFKSHGLTQPQFNILRILRGQYPEPATVNLLIDRMLDKSSNASRIVDKLETKGLVARRQCKHDRRAVDVIITDNGLELISKLDDEMAQWEGSHKSLSEEECKLLNQLLDKMRITSL